MDTVAAVGEAFFSASFEAVLGKLNASDLINFARKEKFDNELKKWERHLLGINAVLTDAEEKQETNRSVKIWLDELRDLADDVEDLLEEFEYEALRRNLTAAQSHSHTTTSTVIKMFLHICLSLRLGGVGFRVKMGPKMKRIGTRLQEIVTQQNQLELGVIVGGRANKAGKKRVPTTSLVNEVNVFGREKDKEAILKLLLAEKTGCDAPQVPVIPITGMGGVGKTTLAQLVYNDDKVKDFLKAWIHVSQDFDVIEVTKAILKHVTSTTFDVNDLNWLHLKLKEELSGKKFLLVLDDVWHQKIEDWSLLICPFEVGNSESKIIITSRNNQIVSQVTGSLPAYHLKGLADDECLSVLACHALGSNNFDGHPHLKQIGTEIVKKSKGSPLAVKNLACLLRTKLAYKEWETVSRSKMWDLPEENGGILPALRWSYHELPSEFKRCFVYCSLLPKDYEFDQDELVLLWLAAGFLQLEDRGRECFSQLLSRSFFQQSNNNESKFVMHDLNIDLAQSVAEDLCFNMENGLQTEDVQDYFGKARHVSFVPHQYDVSPRFEIFNRMKHVRSLLALAIPNQTKYCYLSSKVLDQLVPQLKLLRVLSLRGYFIGELSNSIGDLKHLWYLNLSNTAIGLLPESVTYLYCLKILLLNQCAELVALPVEIGRLTKLRHLGIADTPKLKEMPPGLGKLTGLRVLPKFIIGEAGGLRLRDLKDFTLLQGQLSILGLRNVVDIQDARIANLRQKHGLTGLALEWGDGIGSNSSKQMQVLERLHPPEDLKRLSISHYGAEKLPSWVGNPSFAKIVQIDLSDCINCASLPSLGQLPSLRNLNIKGMSSVTSLGREFYGSPLDNAFPSLESLRFENMKKWEKWISPDVQVFPVLRELILHGCPKLAGDQLPRGFSSLVKLDVRKCPRLTYSALSFPAGLGELTIEDSCEVILRSMADQSSITKLKIQRISGLTCLTEELTKALVKLQVLEIEDCSEFTCLWLNLNGSETDAKLLPCLKSLAIKNCPELVSLVGEEQRLCCLSSLEELRIERCQNFVCFPDPAATGLPCTLRYLKILDCKSLESLPDSNNHHCFLEELEITGCPSLTFFLKGKLLLTLKRLRIENCGNIQWSPVPEGEVLRRDDNQNNASRLEYLCLGDCLSPESFLKSGLSFPNLKIFGIHNCKNLMALPDQMRNLTCLQKLSFSECVALTSVSISGDPLPPSLISLEIVNCKMLGQPMSEWGLDKLHYLKEIKIVGACPAADMVSFPDEEGLMLPPTLTILCLEGLQKLKSLSRGLENLMDLQELQVKDCSKLRFLPKTGLPASLGRLSISGCPVLQDKCIRGRGYWSIVSHIPCLEIN